MNKSMIFNVNFSKPHSMKRRSFPLLALSFFLLLSGTGVSLTAKADRPKKPSSAPKYIFFFIGDGMGLAQASAAEVYLSSVKGKIGFEQLNLSKLPVQSLMTTYSQSHYITCSSASGTALATGHKTSNGTVSMDSAHKIDYKSIATMALEHKMKVGIITSVSLDHATPAVFYAHEYRRSAYYNIGLDLANSGFHFLGGGGLLKNEGEKPGDVRVVDAAARNGYRVVNSVKDFEALRPGQEKVIAISPVLTDGESLPYAIDDRGDGISLAMFTSKAIELLYGKQGFFMMVEGGKIDWACHANDAATVVKEVIDFDEAIGVALEFYKKHPEETLIVVTADHETGGMSLGTDGMDEKRAYGLLQYQKCSVGAFSERILEYKEKGLDTLLTFESILDTVQFYYGLGNAVLPLNEVELIYLNEAYNQSLGHSGENTAGVQNLYGENEPLAAMCTRLLNRRAGIGWTTSNHTALPVPVHAVGNGQEMFTGYLDNADIPVKVMQKLNWIR